MNVDKQRNFFMMNKGNNKKITELRTNVQRDFRNVRAGRLSCSYFFLSSLVYISVFIWFIFLLTPGFAPLTNWIGQAVGAAIFYSILILSRLDTLIVVSIDQLSTDYYVYEK
jgi:bacteriorhodopsin